MSESTERSTEKHSEEELEHIKAELIKQEAAHEFLINELHKAEGRQSQRNQEQPIKDKLENYNPSISPNVVKSPDHLDLDGLNEALSRGKTKVTEKDLEDAVMGKTTTPYDQLIEGIAEMNEKENE